jgi:hypothetical protein
MWIKSKRQRTVHGVAIGVAGDTDATRLVQGLRRTDGVSTTQGVLEIAEVPVGVAFIGAARAPSRGQVVITHAAWGVRVPRSLGVDPSDCAGKFNEDQI